MPPSEPVSTASIIVPSYLAVRSQEIFIGDPTHGSLPPVVLTALYLLQVKGMTLEEIVPKLFQNIDRARATGWLSWAMSECQRRIQAMKADDLTDCDNDFATLWQAVQEPKGIDHAPATENTEVVEDCPRCKGTMMVKERDGYGVFSTCLSCGYVHESSSPPAIELVEKKKGRDEGPRQKLRGPSHNSIQF